MGGSHPEPRRQTTCIVGGTTREVPLPKAVGAQRTTSGAQMSRAELFILLNFGFLFYLIVTVP